MSSDLRLSRGPAALAPTDARERAILDLAVRYVLAYPGSTERGELADHWYRKVGPTSAVRAAFLVAAGHEDLLDDTTGHEVEVHLDKRAGWVGVTVWFRSADRLRRFVKKAGLEGAVLPGLLPVVAETLPVRHTRSGARARNRNPASQTIARVLAMHYLSDEGGGHRSLEEAANLYREQLEEAAMGIPAESRPGPEPWDALADGWRTERSRVLAQLREEFGAL